MVVEIGLGEERAEDGEEESDGVVVVMLASVDVAVVLLGWRWGGFVLFLGYKGRSGRNVLV
jgi:hypothetical protein